MDSFTRKYNFPPLETSSPEGIVAIGGDLNTERLLIAYLNGIFPWYNTNQPIIWWSPDPRLILYPEQMHVSRTLKKILRKNEFSVTIDQEFAGVIRQCAVNTKTRPSTWITSDMEDAYNSLFRLGFAHSIETWKDNELVGGLYGIAIGKAFFGESMFSRKANASKVALRVLCLLLQKWNYRFIDCQVVSTHMISLGAKSISRTDFISQLKSATNNNIEPGKWSDESCSIT